jgi:hypothetical protein
MPQYLFRRVAPQPYNYEWMASSGVLSIAEVETLMPPNGTTYCTIQAIGGDAFFTLDGSNPTQAAYDGTIPQGETMPVQGPDPISRMKLIGTSVCVNYYK